jgi:hypothetical protein
MGRFDALTQLEEKPEKKTSKKSFLHDLEKLQPRPGNRLEGLAVFGKHSPPLLEKPARPDKPDTADKQAGTSSPVAHAPANNRPVKPRHGFDIYWDQYEALVKFSNEEKLQGGTGSMSAMAREALDDYIAKRKKQ